MEHQKLGIKIKKSNSGFTLIELLIVVAIIGILAAVAIPYFEGYMIRARLVEVENAMAMIKSAVSSYRQEKENSWPDCPDLDTIRTSLGVGLRAINRVSDVSIDVNDGTITATISNIHSMVDGKEIMLKPIPMLDSSIDWVWDYGPGFPIQFRQRGS